MFPDNMLKDACVKENLAELEGLLATETANPERMVRQPLDGLAPCAARIERSPQAPKMVKQAHR